ncbi:sigma-70 family RNA polymerase sigma factor [Actinomadura logoneensis]|uniref:Sigma-70 family RNA polymerase sigma factor n=1 Tax=Actinomadura logoneensis TaxID=2293572 RepID=A0A372JPX1_9ACTN|nr:sigma-70 family RNA polymerase sigma factor [Actinomadura logoneensis]RFU42057.1 sigma-70 family RNA polymerase sigma factor [Actinomadura logoneensis]
MSSLTLDTRFARPAPRSATSATRSATVAARSATVAARSATAASRRAERDAGDRMKALVLRAREGDAEAFGQLYGRYLDLVYRYVYHRTGAHSLSEDLTSETFLRAWRRMGDFNWQGKDFGAWLVTIARNLVTDHFKSGRHRLEVCTADLVEPDRPQEGPEHAVLDSMTHRAVLAAVLRLGEEQRECVVLRFVHGLSVAETAVAMGKKTGAVKALQYRAVRSLARMLPDDLRS